MKINSRSVRIQASKIEIEKDLPMGSEVTLRVTGDVVEVQHKDCFDGSEDLIFVVKGVLVEQE